ncbi:MAG: bacillithiol system redox-active protein YtxJ [Crocinitomicaceae bacterium]|jgi:bacillithiol system protein YtxJ|nr:bacillithiol system redox-active protein YtxJ [Crocinitomicaceae bacterium]MCF8410873.1 bacillithiol system redox-active protein YtxJ [Crocinitomicaceae bacterium]MCF8444303.1 bacillithiol system redox-active protein YtxJ [Crocinitomicaceae bacterium]
MSWFSNKSAFPWIQLSTENTLDEIIELSFQKPVILFKHSTRCSISSMALSRFEREWDSNLHVELFYLDLIAFRELSNEIARFLNVEHQSPQVLLLKNGEVIYIASHNGISAQEIKSAL